MVTLQDIARQARVSAATVSKVVNRRPDVGEGAIAAVEAAVAELGYSRRRRGRPRRGDGRGGSANGRRTNRLALLVPGLPRSQMHSPVYADVLHGVEAAVRESGKSFMLTHLPPDAPCPATLFPQKVDGVILFGATADRRLIRRLRATACVQVMGRIERDGWWDHVSYDNGKLGQLAADYLLARGHRQVAYLSNSDSAPHLVERCEIFRDAIRAAGGDCLEVCDNELLTDTGSIQQVAPQRLSTLLDQLFAADTDNTDNTDRHGPARTDTDKHGATRAEASLGPSTKNQAPRTALFLAGDILAPAVCGELQRRGLVVGRDIDIISCNNEQLLLAHLRPRPATLDIHAERVGRKAVEQLLWRLDHPDDPRVTVALQPTLVEAGGELPTQPNCL